MPEEATLNRKRTALDGTPSTAVCEQMEKKIQKKKKRERIVEDPTLEIFFPSD